MPTFKDKEQQKKLETLHAQEEEQLAQVLSQKYNLLYVDLSRKSINTDALRLVQEKDAREAELAVFDKVGKRVFVAIRTPNNKRVPELIEGLERAGFKPEQYMVSSASLNRAWERYKDLSFAVETKEGLLDISGESITKLLKSIVTLKKAAKEIGTVLAMKKAYRISRIVETILASAIALGASDVHVEPEEGHVRLRLRLDGVLTDILFFDEETYNLLLSRVKLLSGLKLNIKDTAQDGRFSIAIHQKEIEVRTSILPGSYGESIVLRVLNPDTLLINLEELGMQKELVEIVNREIKKPNGLILTTGPTGSGKTTTLYAFLRKIQKPEIKIVTIENPIEYHIEGIVQTQTDKDYTFHKGLISTLRQDPDVIMVGEIRDKDVAETAIHAALTGHLVLSTLHTNNAAGAIPRLIDLGINPKIMGSAINIVMAQRLVRKLRDDCKKEVTLSGKAKKFVDETLAGLPNKTLIPRNTTTVWEPMESEACGTGYKGRVGVFEAILMDKDIENLIKENPSEREIATTAKKQGFLTMEQDGVLKALRGITSLHELERVLDADVT